MAEAKYRLVQRGDGEYYAQTLIDGEWIFYTTIENVSSKLEAETMMQLIIRRNQNTIVAEYDASGNRIRPASKRTRWHSPDPLI